MTRKELKQEARQLLKNLDGKYQLFLFPLLLLLFSAGLTVYEGTRYYSDFHSTSTFPWVIQLIESFFSVSALITMLDVVRRKKTSVTMSDSTRTFSTLWFGKLLSIFIIRFLLMMLWSIPSVIGLVLIAFAGTDSDMGYVIMGLICYLAGLGLSINRTFAYSQAEFVLYDQLESGQTSSARQILKTSAQLMKGKKFKLFILEISFLGWYLLVPFTLGLIFIYLLPYLYTTRAAFYQTICSDKD